MSKRTIVFVDNVLICRLAFNVIDTYSRARRWFLIGCGGRGGCFSPLKSKKQIQVLSKHTTSTL